MAKRRQVYAHTETNTPKDGEYVKFLTSFINPDKSRTIEIRNEKGVINSFTLSCSHWEEYCQATYPDVDIKSLKNDVKRLQKLDSQAATHVESQIVMLDRFTGESPYVGWEGLGLALREELDEKRELQEKYNQLKERMTIEDRLFWYVVSLILIITFVSLTAN